jgi:PIN domain nuclease of toxin-antitoxin system
MPPKTSSTLDLPLLLDTHIWIWALELREREIPSAVLRTIDFASRHGHVLVSAISLWEVAMLAEKRRITLSAEPFAWIETAIGASGMRVVELTPRIAVESTRLPGKPHGDPADLILMATARSIGARLVTRDRRILTYAEREQALAVLDARH